MPGYPQLYDATGTALVAAPIVVTGDRGTTFGAASYQFWNDKGGTHADAVTLRNPMIVPKWYDGTAWRSTGHPVVDEAWIQMSVTGKVSTGDPSMADQVTAFVPCGANNPAQLRDIPKNCARLLSVQIVAPTGYEELVPEILLELISDNTTVVLPYRLGVVASGVVPDRRIPWMRRLRRGRKITAGGGATVTVTTGAYTYDGVPYNRLDDVVTLNQNAADGALVGGQSYIAVLSQVKAGGVTTTKSNRGGAPTKPATPVGEIYLGAVTVAFQAGGTSIINSGSVDLTGVVYGEFLVEAGAGLAVTVGGGVAIVATDRQPFNEASSSVAVTDNTTSYVWVRPDGTFSVTITTAPPIIGSELLAVAVAVAGVVTVTDARRWVDQDVAMHLSWLGPPGAGVTTTWDVLDYDAYLYSVGVEMGSLGAGAGAGSFKWDVLYWSPGTSLTAAGTTVYTSSGTSDKRPVIAYNAAAARSPGNLDHEVNFFSAGTRFRMTCIAVPATTTEPQDAIGTLLFRRK